MNNKTFFCVCLAFAFVFNSCSGDRPKEEGPVRIFKDYPLALDSIIRSPSGIIHNIELGETRSAISKKENAAPEENDSTYLFYEYTIDSLANYSIAYSFSNDTLEEIDVQITTSDPDYGNEIITGLKSYYLQKYTSPIMDKGFYVFNCFDSKKNNFKLSLTDNSTTECAIINLLVYREK